jgi:hypothetical protein
MDGTKILNNTSVAAWWANGIRIAGGKNVQVTNNLVNSVAANNAMEVGVFGDTGQPLESATVDGNVLIGGGGWNGTDRHGVHVGSLGSNSFFPDAYTVATISNNIIRDSLRAGLKIGATNETVTVSNNTIDHPANQGIWIASGVTGTGTFSSNTVSNLLAGQTPFQNDSPSTFTATLTGNSWQVSPPPVPTGLTATDGNSVPYRDSTAECDELQREAGSRQRRAVHNDRHGCNCDQLHRHGAHERHDVLRGGFRAVNSVGASPNSAQVSATPSAGGGTLPAAPTGLSSLTITTMPH